MKTLYLIRHAKSDWYKGVQDFERPLNKRGIQDAPQMGKHLKSENIVPDLIISSDANRAISTARLIAHEIDYDLTKIVENHNLYHASPKAMVKEIWTTSNEVDTLFVFGHNPGISELVEYLTEDWVDMKTCCVAKITFDLNQWEALVRGTGTLENVISPKEL
jgi:phosphohistidine phosphatase